MLFNFYKQKMINVKQKIVEKKKLVNPQNDQFVVGNFWFRKSDYFFEAIEDQLKKKIQLMVNIMVMV